MASTPSPSSSRPTVLVVDDSREVLDGLCNLLRSDCSALIGFNGLEALALAASETPDLIVLDVAMPGMDGYEVLRRLKEDPATAAIPVVFLATPGQGVSEARALELGAIDFITKPYDAAILRARIHNQLAYKRSLDAALALSMGDALTGIANRRRFDEQLHQEWLRSLRSQKPLSLILMDIDHFKRFNDALGHPAGDACLQRVAEALKGSLKRSTDFVARYGGEEFACILSDTDLEGARDVAQRIVTRVAGAAIPHPDSPLGPHVTLSLGVATLVPPADGVPADLVLAADHRLYEAKRQGRNRIWWEAVPVPHTQDRTSQPTVLLVEDDPAECRRLVDRLAPLGVVVRTATTAAEAMPGLLQEPPTLVLSSDLLPGMDARALAQWMQEQPLLRERPLGILGSTWAAFPDPLEVDDHLSRCEPEAVFRLRVRLLLELATVPGACRASVTGTRALVLAAPGGLRAALLALLSSLGIRATFAADPEEARTALALDPPGFLVLDLGLLARDPADILDRFRSTPGCQALPIAALGAPDQGLLLEALESRLQDHLEVPLTLPSAVHRLRLLARLASLRSKYAETRSRSGITP